jgi:hypothetical protein
MASSPVRRFVAWTKPDPAGAEAVSVTLEQDRLSAVGTAIGSDPEPYRLDYELVTGPAFVTRLVRVTSAGDGWSRSLQLSHDGGGAWTVETTRQGTTSLADPGGDGDQFAGALDPDLGLSPLFNTMPVLRHGLLETESGAHDLVMVWISVPDLGLHRSPQRYTHRRAAGETPAVVLFEAVGDGADFRADIQFDSDGLVLDYPHVATRIRPAR